MNDSFYLLAESYNSHKALRLMIKLLPFGDLADNSLSSFYTKEKERRLKVFFEELNNGSIILTEEEIQSDDFLHKFYITLKAVVGTKRTLKIQYFARLLNNSNSPLLNNETDSYEDFIKVLDELTFQEIQILISLRSFEKKQENKYGLNNMGFYRPFKKQLSLELNISENEVVSLFIRLERTGLIQHYKGSVYLNEVQDYIITSDLFKKLETFISFGD